jgi:hypothetical protein
VQNNVLPDAYRKDEEHHAKAAEDREKGNVNA